MSRVFAAYSVGGLIGPALGVFGGVRGPFLAYLVLLVFAVPLVLLVAEPATRREVRRRSIRTPHAWLRVASAAILFAVLALGVLEGVLPLHFAERLSQAQIGAMYVGASIVVAVSASASWRDAAAPTRVRGRCWLAVAGISLAGLGDRASRSGWWHCCSPQSELASVTRARSECSSRPCRWSES